MSTTSLTKEKSPIWHPFTQMKTAAPPLMVKGGDGVYLQLEDGRQIIDCISSWWVNIHGHSNEKIARAIYDQALTLEHVIFAGFTHEPAEKLAKRLLTHLPNSLSKIFYSDNGSTAVEVALKMVIQYWHNSGQARTRLIAFDGGYHGDTLGSMSVGRTAPFWEPFKSMMCAVDTVPFPTTWDADTQAEEREQESINCLRQLVEGNPSTYAAIIIEPLIQGAGGMRFCRPEFLQKLQKAAHELDILLIYDEVMTGFGRTGDWFACVKAQTTPDIVCLSKGITGGFLPLAVTVTSDKIFNGFYSDDVSKTFFHGHSYTANPLACAAALASMDILEQTTTSFMDAEKLNREIAAEYLESQKLIEHMRFCGTITAFEVTTSDGNNYFDQIGAVMRQKFLERGFLIRPLGNTLYLMPPYCLTNQQRLDIFANIADVIREIA
ncbi:MAG: adenosylmethionine--8-amino-7-oxononanoate transaminase [Candidatus Obscuribacterales bacterium]|nr:adenosylmethionine--8-amino-7-oxononanoate transaminase [Candidatus Obscuribacterales bacterium]